ncbi:MAG: PucR family transcriptional regulator ligand-binding domain-containing protein [Candidatus Pelethousia sp.]|nr:PucR family transcriptional regulator ligand-binding domain-containing protein [Candidatus Pelethousia sp.]
MIVSELLQLPTIKGLKVIAGGLGLHRNISTVTVVDAPDGTTWLRGGEFVVMTGYAFKDAPGGLATLIETLASRNVSGLGLKCSRYFTPVPQMAIDMANKLDFPLISVPEQYAFCDIINPTLSRIVDKQAAMLLQASKIHKEFIDLAVNNNSVPEILQALSAILGRPTVFIDMHFRQCYCSDYNSKIALHLTHLNLDNFSPDILASYESYPVANDTKQFGYLVTPPDTNADVEDNTVRTALEYAGVVLILRMLTRISNQNTEEKYKNAFFEDLLTNNVKTEMEIHNRARLYGWDLSNGGLVVIVDINNIKKYYNRSLDAQTNEKLEAAAHTISETSIQHMLHSFPAAKYYRQSDAVVFILSEKATGAQALFAMLEAIFHRIRENLAASSVPFTITMGVGGRYTNVRNIHQSYAEARMAITLGYQMDWFDCALFYDQLGVYRLLAGAAHSEESEEFFQQYIQPLVDYDARYHACLVDTLQTVVRCGWNLKSAGEAMFIHYNSIKYRFSKICEVLGVDLHSHDNQLSAELALKMYMMIHPKWTL